MSTLTISSASELNLFKVEGVLGNDRTEEGELHRLEADVVQLDRGESVGDVWIQERVGVWVYVWMQERVGVWVWV